VVLWAPGNQPERKCHGKTQLRVQKASERIGQKEEKRGKKQRKLENKSLETGAENDGTVEEMTPEEDGR